MHKADTPMHEQAVNWPLPENARHLAVPNLVAVGEMPERRERIIPHHHDCWEIDMVLEGDGRFTLTDRIVEFHPGTVLVTPPGRPHSTAAEEGFRNRWVAVETVDTEQEVRVLELDTDHALIKAASMLADEVLLHGNADATLVRHLFAAFMSHLRRALGPTHPHQERVAALARRIAARAGDPDLKLAECLDAVPLSRRHLRRLFREQMGCTPKQYLINIRLQQARAMLSAGRSVKQTAHASGFRDQYYFSRLFKRRMGVPPSQYGSEH